MFGSAEMFASGMEDVDMLAAFVVHTPAPGKAWLEVFAPTPKLLAAVKATGRPIKLKV